MGFNCWWEIIEGLLVLEEEGRGWWWEGGRGIDNDKLWINEFWIVVERRVVEGREGDGDGDVEEERDFDEGVDCCFFDFLIEEENDVEIEVDNEVREEEGVRGGGEGEGMDDDDEERDFVDGIFIDFFFEIDDWEWCDWWI